MKNKILAAIAVAVLSLSFLGGCGPKINESQPDDYEVNLNVDKNTEAILSVMVPSGDGGLEAKYVEAIAEGFKELFPKVKVTLDYRDISDNGYAASINSAIASGKAPDLFYTNTGFYYYLISKNCIVNLEPYYKAAKDAGVLNLESDYYTSFFSMSEYDGKRYVVPRSMDSVVTYYNTDILAAAGIDPKTDARFNNAFTWEQFNSLLDDVNTYLTSAQAKTDGYADCYALDPCFEWEAVYNPIMQSYGANIFDENGNITVESENMTEMATMINTISKKGRIIKPYSSAYNFKAGKCAFFFSSYGPTKMNEELAVRGKFDALPFPLIGENGKIGCGFAGGGISSRSSATQRDLAWQFLSYMISKEGQMALINNGLATPSIRIDLAEEKQWSKGFENLNLDAWLVSEDKKICTDYFVKFDPSKMFGIQNAVQNFMKNISDFSKNNSVTYFIGSFKSDLEAAIA
jgi:ABC-type glycerol-3-phosphate transport system substrate-binding protein